MADKLLAGAHDVHAAAATELTALANAGVLVGPAAGKAKSLLDQSENDLLVADKALAAGNASDVAAEVAAATALVAQIEAMIPAGGHK